jgi:hypothetical protein
MTHMLAWVPPRAGAEYVEEKVKKLLRLLTRPYGFLREHEENLISNAKYHGMPLARYKAVVDKALNEYISAHRRLPVYNQTQWLANMIPRCIAESPRKLVRLDQAVTFLEVLQRQLNGDWDAVATEYRLTPSGKLARWEPA